MDVVNLWCTGATDLRIPGRMLSGPVHLLVCNALITRQLSFEITFVSIVWRHRFVLDKGLSSDELGVVDNTAMKCRLKSFASVAKLCWDISQGGVAADRAPLMDFHKQDGETALDIGDE